MSKPFAGTGSGRISGMMFLAAVTATGVTGCEDVCEGDACSWRDGGSEPEAPLPDLVRISDPGLHPEGIEYDAERGRFLVSSVTRGTVTSVADDGSHTVFLEDPDVVSSIGIHIDAERNRLLVANSDVASFQGGDGHARLGVYDLDSGERLFMAELGGTLDDAGGRFANDVTVGPDGTAYVTDSMVPVIYRVSTDGDVSVLVRDGVLAEGGFLNGIDYHPDGYLLVAQGGARALLKVDLAGQVSRVAVDEPFDADGLSLMDDGRLVVVAATGEQDATVSEVLLFTSSDDWASADITGRAGAADAATTAALRGNAIYVIDARFGDMGTPEPAPHFDITRVPLP